MQFNEVIRRLQTEGFAVSKGRIRHAIHAGYLSPKPRKGPRGAYQYEAWHLQQLRRYLVDIRPGPAPRQPKPYRYLGHFDRVHRLQRKREDTDAKRQRRVSHEAAIKRIEKILDEIGNKNTSLY